MARQERHIFAAGNTARGFVQWYDSVLKGLEQVYILQGPPGCGKSTLIQSVGEKLLRHQVRVEWIHSPLDHEKLDGVILPDLQMGIVDGTPPRLITPQVPLAVERVLDLSNATDVSAVRVQQAKIRSLQEQIGAQQQRAYDLFAEALKIHDEWERYYITNMNFADANRVTGELIERIFAGKQLEKPGQERHMYFGAATFRGAVDYILDLTDHLPERLFIKGRPGSGKSTMLKKLLAEARQRGFDTEVYHCGFDPNSLDMLVFPERGIALFDSTAPHEYFPVKESDEIVDMYERAIKPGTDEKYADQLQEVEQRYKAKMSEATSALATLKALRDEVTAIYAAATDFSRVEEQARQLYAEIKQLSSSL